MDHLLLGGTRVVDAGDRVGEAAARLLADLGARTVRVEPPEGSASRREAPLVDGHSIGFALRNVNKEAVLADLGDPAGRAAFRDLLSRADIAFLTPAMLQRLGPLGPEHGHLVVVSGSPFGRSGPRRHWQATDHTLTALSGALSRSGRPGAAPRLPPEGIATATAAAQAAWTALVAHRISRRTGTGQLIDLSYHEAVVTGLDPAFGAQGSAAAGRSGTSRRGRPPADSYPIYRCADGFVRLCLLAPRQWRGMFGWLGEPPEFADPRFDAISARFAAADRLEPLISALFADRPAEDLVTEAARRGVPLTEVLTLGQALAADHFTKAGTVAATEIAPGLTAAVPVGFVDVDGVRLGIRTASPGRPTEGPEHVFTEPRAAGGREPEAPPFAGLRVLDLGVIVFGAEVARAFADLGADVIKVESRAFPDGLRQTRGGEAMNASFAWGNRGKRSLGLDLRSPEGRAVFLHLVRRSDVVLSNFKPGTLDSLGIGYGTLSEENPAVVVLESAAFSARGPWSGRLGYGPLVRAAGGVTSRWKYAADDTEAWDGVTVFPDHVAARLGAVAVCAALLARENGGRGRHLEIAQSDVVLHQQAALAAWESLRPGSVAATGNRGRTPIQKLFACAGDDEWCVVEARDGAEVERLRLAVGATADLEDGVARWTASRQPAEAAELLQAAGIPAAPMVRLPELRDDAQLRHRGTYTTLDHPLLDGELPAEDVRSPYSRLSAPVPGPAPLSGADTVEICRSVLGLGDPEIDELVKRGVLQRGDRSD